MAEITDAQIAKSFEIGKSKKYVGMSQKAAINALVQSGMNVKSANIYAYAYTRFIEAKLYTQTISTKATEYYLQRIYEEDGINALSQAVKSLSSHIEYYKEASKSNVFKNKGILDKFQRILKDNQTFAYPDDMEYVEGKTKVVYVNIYERNIKARNECISHYGPICQVCSINFEEMYGEIGQGFIHVHHLVEIHTIGKEYKVNPIEDLIPVCPNCHAMLHKHAPPLTVDSLKTIIQLKRATLY